MTLFDFLNINIEPMRDQFPGSSNWECVTKILSCGDLLLYLGVAMRTIWFYVIAIHSLQNEPQPLELQLFLIKYFCINVSKTEAMVLNHMLLEDEYPDTIISLRNVPLQNWTEFKYLFSCISQSEHSTGDTEINHRIQMEYAKFATMAKTKNQLKFCRKLCRSAERSNHSFLTIW